MIGWIGLVVLICLVWGSVTFYQAEENDNITITLDIQTKHNLSAAFLDCVFQSEPVKTVYYMVKGDEVPGAQHQQFAGRVQCDRDALRKGRIRLHLSTVTARDSGRYRCDLVVDYDNIKKQWAFKSSDYFVLNVTPPPAGQKRGVSINTPDQAGQSYRLKLGWKLHFFSSGP
ncbi:uncharacterized protein LOC113140923 isoform X2 [Mastacembelus armatus]|uniref:uncharacterized protein LOC113140923 isoform X2 n=1 Tax=Mastacembelus armatus TaxID=205130 RepID=UPI000E45CD0F|nr:uncharacterized protein LOC113140923 isoform X2 [Mastacembelus armatus]